MLYTFTLSVTVMAEEAERSSLHIEQEKDK